MAFVRSKKQKIRGMALAALAMPLLIGATVHAQRAPAAHPMKNVRPVTNDMLLHPDNGDWPMWRRTDDGFAFSPLDQSTKPNVGDLRVAWPWLLTTCATVS